MTESEVKNKLEKLVARGSIRRLQASSYLVTFRTKPKEIEDIINYLFTPYPVTNSAKNVVNQYVPSWAIISDALLDYFRDHVSKVNPSMVLMKYLRLYEESPALLITQLGIDGINLPGITPDPAEQKENVLNFKHSLMSQVGEEKKVESRATTIAGLINKALKK